MRGRRRTTTVPFSLFAFQDIITSVTGMIVLVTLILTLELILRDNVSPAHQTANLIPSLRQAIDEGLQEAEALRDQIEREKSDVDTVAKIPPQQLDRQTNAAGREVEQLRVELEGLSARRAQLKQQHDDWKAQLYDREPDRQRLEKLEQEIQAVKDQAEQLRSDKRVIYNPIGASGKQAWLVDIEKHRIVTAPAGKRSVPIEFAAGARHSVASFMKWAHDRMPGQDYFVLLIRPSGIEAFRELQKDLADLGFSIGFDLIGEHQVILDPVTGAGY